MDNPKLVRFIVISLALVSTGIVTAFVVAIALLGFTEIQQKKQQIVEQSQRTKIEQARIWWEQKKYLSCADTMNALLQTEIESETPLKPDIATRAQFWLGECQDALLREAEELAKTGRFQDAIHRIMGIADSSPEAQQQVRQWSVRILEIAQDQYREGRFEEAVQIASAVSLDNPMYQEAQIHIQRWQNEWATNQQHLQNARAALSSNDVEVALAEIKQMTTHPAWAQAKEELMQEVEERVEKEHDSIELPWVVLAGSVLFTTAAVCGASTRR